MSLAFKLNKIKIDPVCHIQLLRHAEEFQQKSNTHGQLYGALYDDEAQVTSILSLPDGQRSSKEELQSMERRNDQLLSNFNLDKQKIGWYLVCYTRNYWDYLEAIKFYENYINTSFFLVFDYNNRIEGKNPYRAFRLKSSFASKDTFKWQDLQKTDLQKDNPLEQIPVQVQKNELFELMMFFNKNTFLKEFAQNRKKETDPYAKLKQNIDDYMNAFDEREEIQKYLNQSYLKGNQGTANPQGSKDKTIPMLEYCQYMGQALKLDNYQHHFKNYIEDNTKYEKLFEQHSK